MPSGSQTVPLGCWRLNTRKLSYGSQLVTWLLLLGITPFPVTASGPGDTFGPKHLQLALLKKSIATSAPTRAGDKVGWSGSRLLATSRCLGDGGSLENISTPCCHSPERLPIGRVGPRWPFQHCNAPWRARQSAPVCQGPRVLG